MYASTKVEVMEVAQNFLSTMDLSLTMGLQLLNAETDARNYGWNRFIYDQVIDGIFLAYKDRD